MSRRLLERDDQVAELVDSLTRGGAGHGVVSLIQGPAGIGKTAMLDAAMRAAREDDAFTVLMARASELDRGFGFGIVHQLLEPVVAVADEERRARLFTGAARRAEALFGGTPTANAVDYGVLSGLFWLIANLADERPVALLVDDLHWADVASMRFLEFLARRVDQIPVVVIGTLRPSEPGSPNALLAALQASADTTIEPAPLSTDAVATLLADALGDDPDDAFTRAAREITGGNPLMVSVLAREATSTGLSGRERERDRLLEIGGRGLSSAIVRRLQALGPDAASVARAAAVVGERASFGDLAALVDESVRIRDELGALGDAQILQPGTWAYEHPLVRRAVVASMGFSERERLHRLAAVAMRRRGAQPQVVGLHWLATGPADDPDTVADLRAAAAVAMAEGAPSAAIELLRRAVDERPAGATDPVLLVDLAEIELRLMQPDGDERATAALAAGVTGEDAARARLIHGTYLMGRDPAAAVGELERARREARDPSLRSRVEATLLEAIFFDESLTRDRTLETEPATERSVVESAHRAIEDAFAGEPIDEVVTHGDRALADDMVLLDELGPGRPTWIMLAHALRIAERPEPAQRMLRAGEQVVRRLGLHTASSCVDRTWAYWYRDFGSVARGLAHAKSGYGAAVEPIGRAALAAVAAENLVLLGRIVEANDLMEETPAGPEQGFLEAFVLAARGLTRTLVGDLDRAEQDLRRVVQIVDARGWHAPQATQGRLRLAELLVQRDAHDEARLLATHDVRVAEEAGSPGATGVALRVRALTEDGETRLETLREAERLLSASPFRLEYGRVLLDLGSALRDLDQLAGARTALRSALDIASRTESAWLAGRVRDELHASGARPRRERTSGPAALTASERRVADLAADGLSNREIAEALWITRKTVEYHLSSVYSKLGITSRAALPGALGGSHRERRGASHR